MSKPEINVTPLIDVLLVLLIIFMVVTPMKPSQFEARIPQEPDNKTPVDVNPHTLIVSVNADSTMRINKENAVNSLDEVKSRLAETFRTREQNMVSARTVFIKAPKAASYGSVAKVVDAVKLSGAYPISLQIDNLD